MAKLKIYTYPDKVLSQKAAPIGRVEKRLFKVADDMLETMYEAPGVGLAANQVGLLERIIVVDCDYEITEEELASDGVSGEVAGTLYTKKNPIVLINPEIVAKEEKFFFSEGCLSVPEYQAEVERFKKVKIKYQDLDGLTKHLDAEGLLAVAMQHELDHLDGKLFIERLSELKQNLAKKKLIKERAEREATGAPIVRQSSRLKRYRDPENE